MARAMKDSGIEWIGEIPVGWEISRIKYVADFEPKCDFSNLSADDTVTYTPMENIKNGFYIPNTAPLGTLSTSLTAYQDNDIVMAKVTPCFENGNIAVMSGLSSGVGLGSSELFVFRAKEMQTRYLFYWLQNKAFIERAKSTMTGTGGLKRVSPQFMRDCAIHCPPPDEQARISVFLDNECARIDAVIEQTRASIEEYKRLKQAIITQAVTKGIRPGRKMKASEVEWIGEIPEDWRFTKTLNCLSMPITDGPHTTPELFDEGIAFISAEAVSCGNGRIDFSHKRGYISQEFYEECCKKYIPEIDDIYMIKSGATTGRVSIVDTLEPTFTIWSPLAVFRCNREMMAPRFLYYALQSKGFQKQVEFGWTFGTQQNIGMRTLEQLKVCVPKVEEQKEIVEYLDKKCAEIDSLIHKKQQFLAELESYKKSLIFEYVTGKKEVKV